MKVHYFDINVAQECGVNAAIVLTNIVYWWEYKARIGEVQEDGQAWVFNKKAAWAAHHPYFTERQVRYALDALIEKGYLITGNFNDRKYDRTLWYLPTEKAINILSNMDMTLMSDALDEIVRGSQPNLSNATDKIVRPIPDNILQYNTNTDINSVSPIPRNTSITRNTRNTPREAVTPSKIFYSESVSLTEKEYQKVIEEVGSEEAAKEVIDILDAYKQSNGKKYKSDFAAMRSWVFREYKDRHTAKPMARAAGNRSATQRQDDFNAEIDAMMEQEGMQW